MIVCRRCLQEIESHNGSQAHKKLDYFDRIKYEDDDGNIKCEWCEDVDDDERYEV